MTEPSEVVALHFDEPAAAGSLAVWCGGEVSHPVGEPDMTVILVPAASGVRPAGVGDWIVQEPGGTHAVYSPEEFAARYEPAT